MTKEIKRKEAGGDRVIHPIPPVFNENSKILILGSFPSVKSRESGFFYGHPQNRFWRVLAAIYESDVPKTVEEKRAFLLQNGIAVWDVLASCRILGSSDSSIRDASPNDLTPILCGAPIERIYTNGGTATVLYRRYLSKQTGIDCISLPSSSPANASFSLEMLIEKWREKGVRSRSEKS